jgi:YidC/Oxa1 family membrane protein insertase
MTTPDLEKFHLKRSRVHPTRYIYYFHSLISSHHAYREEAFDFFDIILCPGPHHTEEIRMREEKAQLSRKYLVQFGYPLIDELKAVKKEPKNILIAPSWNSFLSESLHLTRLLSALNGCEKIKLRLHPKTNKDEKQKIEAWLKKNSLDILSSEEIYDDLSSAKLLISDWSGISFEYGLAYSRPVLFIDEGDKRMEQFESINREPVELSWRELFGYKMRFKDLDSLAKKIADWSENPLDSQSFNSDLVYSSQPEKLLELFS